MACLHFLNFPTNLKTGALSTETSGEISTGVVWPIGQWFCLPSREFPNRGHTTMWSTALWGQARVRGRTFGLDIDPRSPVMAHCPPPFPGHKLLPRQQMYHRPSVKTHIPPPPSASTHFLWLFWSWERDGQSLWGLGRCNLQTRGLRRNRDPRREETLPKISPDEGAPMTRDP